MCLSIFCAPLFRGQFKLRGASVPEHVIIFTAFIVTLVAFTVVFAMFVKHLGSRDSRSYQLEILRVDGVFANNSIYRVDIRLANPVSLYEINNVSLNIDGTVYSFDSFKVIGRFGSFVLYGAVLPDGFRSTAVEYNGSKYATEVYIDENGILHVGIKKTGRTLVEFTGTGVCRIEVASPVIDCIPLLLAKLGPADAFRNVPVVILAYTLRRPVLVLSGFNSTIDVVTVLIPVGSGSSGFLMNMSVSDKTYRIVIDGVSAHAPKDSGVVELVYSIERS